MGVERRELLFRVLDIEVNDGKKEWPSPTFTPNTSKQTCKSKSVDYRYFYPIASKVNRQSSQISQRHLSPHTPPSFTPHMNAQVCKSKIVDYTSFHPFQGGKQAIKIHQRSTSSRHRHLLHRTLPSFTPHTNADA